MDSQTRKIEIRKVAFSNVKIAAQLGRHASSAPTDSSTYATILNKDKKKESSSS